MDNELILTFSENPLLSSQLLGKAFQSSGRAVAVAIDGMKLPSSAHVDRLIQASFGYKSYLSAEEVTGILVAAIRHHMPRVVLVGATKLGLEAAPRVAERLGIGYAARALDFSIDPDGTISVLVSAYSGMGTAEYRFHQETVILTVPTGIFEAVEGEWSPPVTLLDVSPISTPIQVIEVQTTTTHESGLEKARAVIDIGRGIREREDIQIVEKLAGLIEAGIACSRPLASDLDWFNDWLGLSGQVVSPELLMAIGVSGAVQHMVGIRKSRVIVAVNQDENAAIFTAADYGVVGDLYQFVPILTERMKTRQIHLA